MGSMSGKLGLFSGSSNKPLAQEICEYLKIPLGKADVRRFSDGEIFMEIGENVRGLDVFLLQSTCSPVNDHLMELLIMIDAFKRASARRITAVLPYYGYARQDRKVAPRVPISAKLVADLLTAAGTNRVLSMDLHASQIQGFFNIPFDHLYAAPIMMDYIKEKFVDDLVMVSPDAGGVERARAFGKRLTANLAIIDKRRESINDPRVMNIIGEVRGKKALMLDDMIDTAGTLTQAADAIFEKGATEVVAVCTHPVLSGPAIERLEKSNLTEVVVTNTIPLSEKASHCDKIRVLSISKILGEAIRRIHNEESVSSLFV
jgi:ribose-phosphate pyrophosphokinase